MRNKSRIFTAVIACALAIGWCVAAHAEKRVALVIGNGAYQNAPKLPNPSNDARDVAAALTRVGFDTILAVDVDKASLDDAEIRFARAARDADVAMFYYSGHALQYNGINYLMPVDAKLTDEADLRRMAQLDDLIADLQQAKNLRILVLNSCRDNPFAEDPKQTLGRAVPRRLYSARPRQDRHCAGHDRVLRDAARPHRGRRIGPQQSVHIGVLEEHRTAG